LFQGTTFWNPLHLTRTKYDKLYIKWSSIPNGLGYDESAYQQLIENFKNVGYSSDADEAYYTFRKEQLHNRIQSLHSFWEKLKQEGFVNKLLMIISVLGVWISNNEWLMKFCDFWAWILYGFGKRPLWSFLWSIVVVVIFGFIWWGRGSMKPDTEVDEYSLSEYIPKKDSKRYWNKANAIIGAFVFSSTVFLSGTKFFVDPPPLPTLRGVSESNTRRIFIIERVLGGFFSVLFFLALTGMVLRPI
jgi:hypothetical protein